jgi:hypothetical protein
MVCFRGRVTSDWNAGDSCGHRWLTER